MGANWECQYHFALFKVYARRTSWLNRLGEDRLTELSLWMHRELESLDHGEIHVILKVRDGRLPLIEKNKIVKEKTG